MFDGNFPDEVRPVLSPIFHPTEPPLPDRIGRFGLVIVSEVGAKYRHVHACLADIHRFPRVIEMKLGIVALATLVAMICSRTVVAGDVDQGAVVKVADLVVVEAEPPLWRWNRPAHRRSHYLAQPVACEAVLFPRSPSCAGRPAAFGPYATYPFYYYWSY